MNKDNMMEENTKWVPFGALVLVLIVSVGFWKIEQSRKTPLMPYAEYAAKNPPATMDGKVAPDFTLPLLRGGEISLADQKGKLLFINIWATWCAPCREEMPSMQKLYEHFKGRDFEMITISIDKGKPEVEAFVKELGLTFPVALDPSEKVSKAYQITGVPETYIIGKDGVIMHHILGPGEWYTPEIITAFERIIAGGKTTQ